MKSKFQFFLTGALITASIITNAQDVSNLDVIPLISADGSQVTKLVVNFQVVDPDKITSAEVLIASSTEKTNSTIKNFDREKMRLWTRGTELKVLSIEISIPQNMIGNCHYVELIVLKSDGNIEKLENNEF